MIAGGVHGMPNLHIYSALNSYLSTGLQQTNKQPSLLSSSKDLKLSAMRSKEKHFVDVLNLVFRLKLKLPTHMRPFPVTGLSLSQWRTEEPVSSGRDSELWAPRRPGNDVRLRVLLFRKSQNLENVPSLFIITPTETT